MAEATPTTVTELPAKGPVNDEALSQKDGADDIAELLGDDLDLGPDLEEGDEEGADAAPSEEDDVDVSEDVETDEDEPTDSPDYAGGRFAADDAKIKLSTGETITVAALKQQVEKRVADFQRDYTAKNETLAVKLKEVDQVAERTSKEREFLIWFAENNVPKVPEPPTEPATVNPLAHLEYAEKMRHYESMAQAWRQMKQAQAQEAERLKGETAAQTRERLIAGANELAKTYPELKDKAKAEKWWQSTVSEAEQNYGFSTEEILGLQDPRMVRALRDANAYRRAKAKAPAIQQEMGRKPVLIQGGGKRSDPRASASRARQQSSERLSRTHSMRDGIEAIAHLID